MAAHQKGLLLEGNPPNVIGFLEEIPAVKKWIIGRRKSGRRVHVWVQISSTHLPRMKVKRFGHLITSGLC